MNTVSSTDAKSNRSGSQQDTDNPLSTRLPQKSASASRTSSSSGHQYSSSSLSLVNDDYFFNEDTSISSPSFVSPYYHPDLSSYCDEQYDDNDMQQHQPHQHHKTQQQQQRQHNHQQQQLLHQDQPLQDSVRDVNSLAVSSRYQGRQGPPLQHQVSSNLRGRHNPHPQPQPQTQPQPQPPQFTYQDHHASYEDQHHDQQYQPGELRFDDLSRIRQQQPHRTQLLARDQHEPFDDDDDDDLEDFLDQEPFSSRKQEPIDPLVRGISTSSTFQRPPRPNSAHEVHSNNFITEEEFLMLADDYLLSLSPKKREKALLSNAIYQKILMVLLQPKNTQVSTAQFRFWAKKMFTLSTTETHHIVCHSGKPVATKECLYDVLVYCHRKSSHGGRDKTSAEVRQHYSWVPKELIARFVKHCPLCSSRRHSLQRSLSGTGLSGAGFELFVPSSGVDDRDEQHHFIASSDHFSDRSSQLDQYSMVEPDQVGHDESIYLNPPQDYRLSQGSSSSLPTAIDRDQQQHVLASSQLQQGARLHSEHMMQLHHQRMQTESALGRYYDDRPPLRSHGHLRSVSGSVHDMYGVQPTSRGGGGFTHPDSSGVGPPRDRIEGLQNGFLDGQRRHGGWSRDPRINFDTDQDVEMLGVGSAYGGSGGGAGRRSSHSGVESSQSRGGHVNAALEEERDDDCTPSGLVGIPQEVRAPGSGSSGAIRRSSQTSTYNRLYLQQQQQQQQQGMGGLTQYPPGHSHQGVDPGSSSSQSMSSTPSALNQHTGTLSSRASGHSRLVMGYPYGNPYPYSPAGGSNSMVHGPIKQLHGSFQPSSQQQQQQQQQQRHSMLSHSTSTTFPQMASGPLGTFQEMRDYGAEEEDHLRDQSVHAGGDSHDGHDQGHGLDPHDPLS